MAFILFAEGFPSAAIVSTMSAKLSRNRMVQFAGSFPDTVNVASMMRHLSWTYFLQLLPLKTNAARWFYAQQCVSLAGA
jgi:hypothetical protein